MPDALRRFAKRPIALDAELLAKVPAFAERLDWFLNYRPDLAGLVSRWNDSWPESRPMAGPAHD
jgi:hypothetical protein